MLLLKRRYYMTQHNVNVSLAHMRDCTREAIEMVAGYTQKDLYDNRMLSLALTRLMEIIGEAASRVPSDFRLQHPAVQWREIIDLRNRLIHGTTA